MDESNKTARVLASRLETVLAATRTSLEAAGLDVRRTTRVDAATLSQVVVNYYGAHLPLGHMATVTFLGPDRVLVKLNDSTTLTSVRKALRDADLGAVVSTDGSVIELVFPVLRDGRRADPVELVRTRVREGRAALEAAQDEARASLDALDLSEEELARAREAVDNRTAAATFELEDFLREEEAALLRA